jgi:predicted O-linked N-acetylglucosamine transferase (SPINDLY family)
MTADLFGQAIAHHRAGRLTEASQLYQTVLARDPGHCDALFLLAGFDIHAGRLQGAVDKLARAIALNPSNAAYHTNLGEAYRRLRRHQEAIDSLQTAMVLRPDFAWGPFNLGALLEEAGAIDGALAYYEHAGKLKPDWSDALERIARVRERTHGRGAKGTRELRLLSALSLVWLASHLDALGAPMEAGLALCRRALELSPRFPPALNTQGLLLAQDPARYDDAIDCFREALAVAPDTAEILGNLGAVLGNCGLLDEAIDRMRASATLAADPRAHGNLVFLLPFHAKSDAPSILAEARRWDQLHAQSAQGAQRRHDNDRTAGRRLRIGYVSPDFRNHCQTFFTLPLFRHHDRARFEIFAYATVHQPDDQTALVTRHTDQWRSLVGVSDEAAAEIIRADRIDILIDLTMHMSRSRPLLFARKSAPVQVCWLAYPGTTGLSSIDYRLTDVHLDPVDADTSVYSEQTVRLPDTFWCYDPLAPGLDVGPLPARANGRITFASLNNFLKVNDSVIELWARVLRAVDGARLLLCAPRGRTRERTTQVFADHGVASDRIELVDRRPRVEYLASHGQIDIALDTFPYNGHTTSLDAFWMGVPVVTLLGKTVVGRAGLCQAMNLGLPELVARTPDDYVRIAVELSGDLDRLETLRAGLRGRMEASPLMDGPRFARNVEAAYLEMWQTWCTDTRG